MDLKPQPDARCNICGHQGPFIRPEGLKEGYQCTNCSASSRNRLVMLVLGMLLGYGDRPVHTWPGDRSIRILEPCPRGPQVAFLKDKFDYVMPEYDAEKIAAGADPREFADVQQLAFENASFDYVIASDIFEHVREDVKGFQEIFRILKPGGTFLLTVPYDHARETTLDRVKVEGEKDIPLVEPRYAGGGGVTLDYREYGRDLLQKLRDVGFTVGFLQLAMPRLAIYPSAIFICARQAHIDLTPFLATCPDADRTHYPSLGPLLPNRLFVWYKFNLRSLGYFLRQARMRFWG
ncbi:MAG: methyltransferase domain-containing protein [candidate division KSB1 bacterium]|nr:methyltransferase domain-containing protein [candidate division KSB1 bacterium]MDQ7063665.1 methyltransferase domain-containing protein [candidate division KSB1 bacterium]